MAPVSVIISPQKYFIRGDSMLNYPNIDPIAFTIGPINVFGATLGPLEVYWYGMMYLFGFFGAWLYGMHRTKLKHVVLERQQVEDLIFYGALGVVLGARIGYIFFYNFSNFIENPLILFRIREGGMSFHGGLIGVMLAMALYCKKVNKHYLDIMDFVSPLVPIGLGLGRLGNFIGQELWGRATDLPWAMIFPRDPDGIARHPSQLYQAFLEGFVLFIILYFYSKKPRPRAAISALFLTCYGVFRFVVEFVREPDAHIGYALGWVTRGQILSIPMIAIGLGILIFVYRYEAKKKSRAAS